LNKSGQVSGASTSDVTYNTVLSKQSINDKEEVNSLKLQLQQFEQELEKLSSSHKIQEVRDKETQATLREIEEKYEQSMRQLIQTKADLRYREKVFLRSVGAQFLKAAFSLSPSRSRAQGIPATSHRESLRPTLKRS